MKKSVAKKAVKNKKKKKVRPEVTLNFLKISKSAEAPEYALDTDAGFDLKALESVTIFPFDQKKVSTGIAIEVPEGYVGIVRDRAGIVQKMNVHTVAGTFDSGFRGEVSIMLVNMNDKTIEIEKGMRIAQIILVPIVKAKITEVKKLSSTERGDKGFGSTGMKEIIRELNKISEKSI
ncbi:MAG: deoxyuridine 5'-triphosphate nucleotidohydrolase [Candidatus Diapherotrites archaeon ADurb.Bin253]|jgi:dUTP pyrophosphatase|nr:MAG: deoxyuridine 5'-triphosphate nucleotidohydrolase [Candidatus Diapherotrites archaeon ADurb.Bin253]HNZ52199.1 dUTP diphosphatase [Candidatus Pacearchaeota archaeon]HOC97208.1 dUTP diphosphatase [Candidatus Pacearchaeota archaeon]HOH04476.1 dUTP diphosphatase [Candidatus Pacearchaeota archaeon]HPX74539.1 dUTP diphosphatase [Candidatus Pacearchaeota archaeon]